MKQSTMMMKTFHRKTISAQILCYVRPTKLHPTTVTSLLSTFCPNCNKSPTRRMFWCRKHAHNETTQWIINLENVVPAILAAVDWRGIVSLSCALCRVVGYGWLGRVHIIAKSWPVRDLLTLLVIMHNDSRSYGPFQQHCGYYWLTITYRLSAFCFSFFFIFSFYVS